MRGLRTKLRDVFLRTVELNYDIYCFTETWLNENFQNAEVFDSNYMVFRCDRKGSLDTRGGGTLIAVKNHVTVHRRNDLEMFDECVWLEISCDDTPSLLIGLHYFSPQLSVKSFSDYFSWLQCNLKVSDYSVILLGDFNVPKVDWDTCDVSGCLFYNSLKATSLINSMNVLGLSQVNDICNNLGVILDLVFVNFPIASLHVDDSVVPVDNYHPALCYNLHVQIFKHVVPSVQVLDYARGNYLQLFNSLQDIDWPTFLAAPDINTAVQKFTDFLYNKITDSIPNKSIRSTKFPPWYSRELIKKIKKKNFLHRKWKKHKNEESYQIFSCARRECKTLLNRDRVMYLDGVENSLVTNPRQFWKYIGQHFKENATNISLLENSVLISEPSEVASAFANHFSKVVTPTNPVTIPKFTVGSTLSPFRISDNEVLAAIKKLKSSKSVGTDKIPSFIIKGCSSVLVPALTYLFNFSLSSSVFPELWKYALIVPIFKKGSRLNVGDYRPISLLNSFSKIFEMVVFEHLYSTVSPYLSEHQHGFVRKRSTVTNLVSFMEYVAPIIENRGQVDVIYFDMSKAFDSVNHKLLLAKLECFGISPPLLNWFKSYLCDRRNIVKISSYVSSSSFSLQTGVPQGSVLGPLLFLIFVNDIFSCIHVQALMYADDLKMYSKVSNNEECLVLQQDIDAINGWCFNNHLSLNLSKTVCVRYSRKTHLFNYLYYLNENVINCSSYVRDLGVIFTSDVRFHKQVANTCAVAGRTLGVLMRIAKDFKNHHSVICLYKSLVLSRLNYASVVWNSLTDHCISKLESIQKKFVYFLNCVHGKNTDFYCYETSLIHFEMKSLKAMRDTQDLIFLYKCINSQYQDADILCKINFNCGALQTRSPSYFYINCVSTLIPLNRMQRLFNVHSLELDLFNMNIHCFSGMLLLLLK